MNILPIAQGAPSPSWQSFIGWWARRPWSTVTWILIAQLLVSIASNVAAVKTRLPLFNADALLLALVPGIGFLLAGFSVLLGACVIVSELFGYKYLVFSVPEFTHNLPYFPRSIQGAVGAAAILAIAWLLFVALHARKARKRPHHKTATAIIGCLFLAMGIETLTGIDTAGSTYLNLRDQLYFFAREVSRSDVKHAFIALDQSDTAKAIAQAAAQRRDVVLVIIESFGEFNDRGVQAQLDATLMSPALQATHTIQKTLHSFEGSTIHGEFRELCGTELHSLFFSTAPEGCVPAQLRNTGYRTSAFHGNDAHFYRRNTWYPTAGLEYIEDLAKLPDHDSARCGGVWNAYCDLDLLSYVARQKDRQPRFDYVLTVNTHLPPEPMTRGTTQLTGCRGRYSNDVCVHLENSERVLRGIAELAVARPDALVIAVGDHAPPFFLDSTKRLFSTTAVPAYILTPR